MRDGTGPLISVVVPHLNEPEDLRACLTALEAQQTDGVSFEIIVVDNGSRELPTAVCAAFPHVRLEVEQRPGPGPARSRGAEVARGAIVAFIDCDCIAQEGWLEGIATHFRQYPRCGVVAGSVGILRQDRKRPTALEAYEGIYAYRVKLYVERDHYAATGNMAVRRDVFLDVGPFAGIATMEDRDWGRRAAARGVRIDFVPEVRVLTPACKSFEELGRRWDRHIAHEFAEVEGAWGLVRWVVQIVAVAASPAYELARLALLPRRSLRDRLLAAACLVRIRLRRARTMLALLFEDQSSQIAGSWNRT